MLAKMGMQAKPERDCLIVPIFYRVGDPEPARIQPKFQAQPVPEWEGCKACVCWIEIDPRHKRDRLRSNLRLPGLPRFIIDQPVIENLLTMLGLRKILPPVVENAISHPIGGR